MGMPAEMTGSNLTTGPREGASCPVGRLPARRWLPSAPSATTDRFVQFSATMTCLPCPMLFLLPVALGALAPGAYSSWCL